MPSGTIMEHDDPTRRAGNETRNKEQIFCPRCAAEPRLFLSLLDPRKGEQYQVFECQCGEIVWDK
jgi:hypothetical protein